MRPNIIKHVDDAVEEEAARVKFRDWTPEQVSGFLRAAAENRKAAAMEKVAETLDKLVAAIVERLK